MTSGPVYRPMGLATRAAAVVAGAALATWGAIRVGDLAYVAGLVLVALAVLSLVSAEARRPPLAVRVAAVVVALAVVVVGVWVPRSAAQAAARADRTITVEEVSVSSASRPGLTRLAGSAYYLTDRRRVQRLDLGSDRASSFVFARGRTWVTADSTLVRVANFEVEAVSPDGTTLWRRPVDTADEEDSTVVAAADGVVVLESCASYVGNRAPACRRVGIGADGDTVFTTTGFDLPATRPQPSPDLVGDDALPGLPSVFVSRPAVARDDVEVRSAADGRVVETVRRGERPRVVAPVVTGGTVLVSDGPEGDCTLSAHRDGDALWSIDDPGCTPLSRPEGSADEQPAVLGERLWLTRYDDRTLTLDLRTGASRLTGPRSTYDGDGDLASDPELTDWTPDTEIRLVGRRLTGVDAASGERRWARTLPRRALRWWVRGDVVAVRSAVRSPLLLDPADTNEQVTVYDSRTGRVRDTLRLAPDDRDERDSVFVAFDDGLLRLAPVDPEVDDGPWRADVLGS